MWFIVQTRINQKQTVNDRYLTGEAELGSSGGEESDNPFESQEEEEEKEYGSEEEASKSSIWDSS